MVVLLLAAGGALVGLAVHGAVGAAIGAVIAALGGVAAGYVPGFRDRAERRHAELRQAAAQQAAAQAGLKAASEPQLEEPSSVPSLLLRPEVGVVGFTGRLAELAELRAWCELGRPRSVLVLVGDGGVGKTRLALMVAAEWEGAGRTAVMLAAGQESEALARARDVTSGPVLLVVDYAETRAGLGDLLRAALDDPGPLRILLIARSLGEWWDRLCEESAPAIAQLLSQAEPVPLKAPIDNNSDQDLASSAIPHFAAKLGVTAPAGVVFELPSRRVPVLVLHAAALVAVLRSMTSPPGSPRVAVSTGVLGELLEHEARYWRRTARSFGLTADGQVLKAAVAASILLGAGSLAEAAAAVGRIPDLAGASAGDLRQWARWLYQLYPGGQAGRLGSVQPDLLAEYHAVTRLAADPALADATLVGLTTDQADQALTVLARAWALRDEAGPVIERALRADLAGLAIPAANVAIQTSAQVGTLLAAALSDAPATLGDLIKIAEALPYPSVAVALAGLAAVQRIRRELPPGTDKQTSARWAYHCGMLLYQAGRLADALPPTEEAIAIYRELAAARPDCYRPDLAGSLNNLGIRFSELGRPADGLAPAMDAVETCRELAVAMPDRYRPDLAAALDNLGVLISELGRPADALPAAEESVAIYRELATASPDRYLPHLAAALNHIGVCLSEPGRPADALPPAQEAVTIRRELAIAMPDRYRPGLASSLNNLGEILAALGRPSDAAAVRTEASACSPP